MRYRDLSIWKTPLGPDHKQSLSTNIDSAEIAKHSLGSFIQIRKIRFSFKDVFQGTLRRSCFVKIGADELRCLRIVFFPQILVIRGTCRRRRRTSIEGRQPERFPQGSMLLTIPLAIWVLEDTLNRVFLSQLPSFSSRSRAETCCAYIASKRY